MQDDNHSSLERDGDAVRWESTIALEDPLRNFHSSNTRSFGLDAVAETMGAATALVSLSSAVEMISGSVDGDCTLLLIVTSLDCPASEIDTETGPTTTVPVLVYWGDS